MKCCSVLASPLSLVFTDRRANLDWGSGHQRKAVDCAGCCLAARPSTTSLWRRFTLLAYYDRRPDIPGVLSAIAMAYPVIRARQWRNQCLSQFWCFLALLNGVSHWGVVTDQPLIAQTSLHGAIMMFVLIISILGGRVIRLFTANGAGVEKAPLKWLEISSITSTILLVPSLLSASPSSGSTVSCA